MVHHGNHDVARVGARSRGLYVAHAIYRSEEQVARKLRQGLAAARRAPAPVLGEHWRAGGTLSDDVIHDVWRTITSGDPDERIRWEATGPMVPVRPGRWPTWDPDGVVPVVEAVRPGEGRAMSSGLAEPIAGEEPAPRRDLPRLTSLRAFAALAVLGYHLMRHTDCCPTTSGSATGSPASASSSSCPGSC